MEIEPYGHPGEIRIAPSGAVSNEIRQFLNMIKTRPSTQEERNYLINELSKINKSVHAEYIISSLFPETSDPCRLPTNFPNPTSVFKFHDTIDVQPSASGYVMISLSPMQTGVGKYLHIYRTFDPITRLFSAVDAIERTDDIPDYYDELALRACSIRIFYMGTEEDTRGYLAGAIDYHHDNTTVPQITDVENGYFYQWARPNDGIRHIWLPKDFDDYNYKTPGVVLDNSVSGIHIYGANLPTDQCLRLDIIRHFEGFPKANMRNYVDSRRSNVVQPTKTLETLQRVPLMLPQLMNLKNHEVEEAKTLMLSKASFLDKIFDKIGEVGPIIGGMIGGGGNPIFDAIGAGISKGSSVLPSLYNILKGLF